MNANRTLRVDLRGCHFGKRSERGSLALFTVVVIFVLFAVVGLVVDGGRKVAAQREATAAAQGAARAGGQAVAADIVAGSGTGNIDTARAVSAARDYLDAAGATGAVDVDGGTLTVTATTSIPTLFVSIVGVSELRATATATARIAQGGATR